jgi:hypothetical protein
MKLFAVVNYHPTPWRSSYPMFHYISEDKNKCEAALEEKRANKTWPRSYSIIEIETNKELNYLITQEIW